MRLCLFAHLAAIFCVKRRINLLYVSIRQHTIREHRTREHRTREHRLRARMSIGCVGMFVYTPCRHLLSPAPHQSRNERLSKGPHPTQTACTGTPALTQTHTNTHPHTKTHISSNSLYRNACPYTHIYIYTHTHTHTIKVYTHICIDTHTHTHTNIYIL